MWTCKECQNDNADRLVACTQCGTSFDGNQNLLFDDEKVEHQMSPADTETQELGKLQEELARLTDRSDDEDELGPLIDESLQSIVIDHAAKNVHNELRKLAARHQDRSAECIRCGSAKIIPEVMVVDQDDGAERQQQLRFDVDQEAWFFKNPTHVTILAQVCAECGNVEHYLSSDEAERLWDAYQRHLKLRR